MQLYDRGIRRRLAPMLGDDRQRLELAYSLLFSLPGTPMMQYGDELGMGDDLSLPERECARTPMQWTGDRHGGFSRADKIFRPAIDDDVYGYAARNVADQRRDRNSLLNWTERTIRMRRECQEISWGEFRILETNVPEVLALRYDWRNTALITLHNFSPDRRHVNLPLDGPGSETLVNVFRTERLHADESGRHELELEGYGYRWLRVGSADNALDRAPYSAR
jgi:maltose alpha-D-glucosyltransferase / alpha-amylase